MATPVTATLTHTGSSAPSPPAGAGQGPEQGSSLRSVMHFQPICTVSGRQMLLRGWCRDSPRPPKARECPASEPAQTSSHLPNPLCPFSLKVTGSCVCGQPSTEQVGIFFAFFLKILICCRSSVSPDQFLNQLLNFCRLKSLLRV